MGSVLHVANTQGHPAMKKPALSSLKQCEGETKLICTYRIPVVPLVIKMYVIMLVCCLTCVMSTIFVYCTVRLHICVYIEIYFSPIKNSF